MHHILCVQYIGMSVWVRWVRLHCRRLLINLGQVNFITNKLCVNITTHTHSYYVSFVAHSCTYKSSVYHVQAVSILLLAHSETFGALRRHRIKFTDILNKTLKLPPFCKRTLAANYVHTYLHMWHILPLRHNNNSHTVSFNNALFQIFVLWLKLHSSWNWL